MGILFRRNQTKSDWTYDKYAQYMIGDMAGACQAWYDSFLKNEFTLVSNKVSQWNDLSLDDTNTRRNRHATQSDSTYRPHLISDRFFNGVTRNSDSLSHLTLPSTVSTVFAGTNPSYIVVAITKDNISNKSECWEPLFIMDDDTNAIEIPFELAKDRILTRREVLYSSLASLAKPANLYYEATVSFDGRLWCIGGREGSTRVNKIWVSDDNGTSWTLIGTAPWAARERATVTKQGNQVVLIGGYDGTTTYDDEWVCTDLSDTNAWTQTQTHGSFGTRSLHKVSTAGNTLVLLGGNSSRDPYYRDINGNWTTVSTNSGTWAVSAVRWAMLNGKIHVISGDSSSLRNYVWRLDGSTWTQVAASSAFSSRRLASVFSAYDKAWVIGGLDAGGTQDDIWATFSPATSFVASTEASGISQFGFGSCCHNGIAYVSREDAQGYYGKTSTPAIISITETPDIKVSLMVVDGTSRSFYLNGVSQSSATVTAGDLSIGGSVSKLLGGLTYNSGGSIDTLAVFTPQEGIDITALEVYVRQFLNKKVNLLHLAPQNW